VIGPAGLGLAARREVVVIGGRPAGLAAAAALGREGADVVVIDAGSSVGASWAGHYDSLRLNTVAWTSHLPGRRFARSVGWYPGRDDVVAYLVDYAEREGLDIRLGVRAERVVPVATGEPAVGSSDVTSDVTADPSGDRADGSGNEAIGDGGQPRWTVVTDHGVVRARTVVLATGSCRLPHEPGWPGRAAFRGRVLHSCTYRSPHESGHRRVLVVGAGNSGGEIAADLASAGSARVWLSVRTAPQTIPRRVLGLPTVLLAIGTRYLPAAIGDGTVQLLRRVVLGDLTVHGLPPVGERLSRQYARDGVVPLSHPGFFAALRRGAITVVPAVTDLTEDGAVLEG
jgi:cation diffusion facilitator CzcD-associated flavoprotein CzcO